MGASPPGRPLRLFPGELARALSVPLLPGAPQDGGVGRGLCWPPGTAGPGGSPCCPPGLLTRWPGLVGSGPARSRETTPGPLRRPGRGQVCPSPRTHPRELPCCVPGTPADWPQGQGLCLSPETPLPQAVLAPGTARLPPQSGRCRWKSFWRVQNPRALQGSLPAPRTWGAPPQPDSPSHRGGTWGRAALGIWVLPPGG